ncbi:hypothetical protein BST97_09695 [Nonlabens spongiae]|uniref:DNA 3'-5' helicase II n=1 Tax=Nonlabens spongiae TaxID=331648 RepID=A0A1W6MKZ7_9FLAO|nr:ATP-dependent helicase [Nonlabens spongiae]ARN78242.1 hypothetical protein BST97_09695 [Nonlabens spongiae]
MIKTPTKQQQIIFDFIEKGNSHGMIDAVAGSGKTSTLINGLKLIDTNNKVLFCAFNKKIQEEISSKTKEYGNVVVRTSYALGLNILKYYSAKFNQKPSESKYYTLINETLKRKKDSWEFEVESSLTINFERIRNIYYSLKEENEPDVFYKTFFSNFYSLVDLSRYTLSYGRGLQAFKELIFKYGIDVDSQNIDLLDAYYNLIQDIIKVGINSAVESGVYDFADMIFLPCYLKLKARSQYDIVLVDECQDLSNAQFKIIRKYLKEKGRFFAVGDPFQSIYGFAGASPKSFHNIKSVFRPQMFELTNCFRCAPEIIELAKDIRPDIQTKNEFKGKVQHINFDQIGDNARSGDYIISRYNAYLFDILFKLLELNKKCKILGKSRILKELKLIIPDNKLDNRNYYENLLYELEKILEAAIKKFGKNPTYLNKLENLRDSISIISSCYIRSENLNTLRELFHYIDGLMNGDDCDSIILSSIHKSKGLESDRVFIIGYPDLPVKLEGMLDWQLYQEECLKYVAITRAKKELFCCSKPSNDTDKQDINSLDVGKCSLDDEIDNLPI